MALLEFYYDFVSPYSYLASEQVEAIASRTGAELRLLPFLLGGVMKATDNKAPAEVAPKYRHLQVDVARFAKRLSLPLRFPEPHPFSTVLAMRCALAAEAAGKLLPFTHAAFRAAWVEGLDLTSPEVLALIGTRAGADGRALVASAPDYKQALLAQTEGAVKRGAFGAPTFFVGEEMFVGNDRLDFVEEALVGRA
jgi:2-hydroxychromene-2-carboxylate isomerase